MALQLRDEGKLNPDMFGVQEQPADAKMISQGIRYSVIIVMVLGALLMIAHFSQDIPWWNCMFPPCY